MVSKYGITSIKLNVMTGKWMLVNEWDNSIGELYGKYMPMNEYRLFKVYANQEFSISSLCHTHAPNFLGAQFILKAQCIVNNII